MRDRRKRRLRARAGVRVPGRLPGGQRGRPRRAAARLRLRSRSRTAPAPVPACQAPGCDPPPRSAARCLPRGLQSFWVTCWPRGQHPAAKCTRGARGGRAGCSEPEPEPWLGTGARAAVRGCSPANLRCERGLERRSQVGPLGLGAAYQQVPWAKGWLGWAPPPLGLGGFLKRSDPRCSTELEEVDGNPVP